MSDVDRQPTLADPERRETVDLRGGKPRPERSAKPIVPEVVPVKIGRYQLLELVGSGGMGMVWCAWDPELERRVAVKLLWATSSDSRERMLREGQILARLSHPNVVPVFDVGVMDDQVYLVMEWIRGTTLRELAKQKLPVRELLAAVRQAGEGLAAAHDAGVIHRDFKPDNVMRGDDARVRVLDFGISHDESAKGSGGTPRYMAPELARGEPVTTAGDQFAFGISLDELVEEMPSWIEPIVLRSTDPDPSKRFASMRALLAMLDRDPARRRRRIVLGVAAIGAAVGAFAIGRSGEPAIEECSGAEIELASSWSPALRDRVVAHLRSLGPAGIADADRVARQLDDYAAQWIGEHERVCRASGALAPALYEARLGCFLRAKSQLAAVGELMGTVAAPDLPAALTAARSIPDVRGCAEATSVIAPPPANVAARVTAIVPQIERALVLATAQRPEALATAQALTREARETRYDPVIARALLVEGRAASGTDAAKETFAEALAIALRAFEDRLAVEAYARWIFERTLDFDRWEITADNWLTMDAISERLGREGRVARALMYNNRGLALRLLADRDGARRSFERARQIAGDSTELELVHIESNLAQLDRDPVQIERRFIEVRERLEASLGPRHPDVLLQRLVIALVTRHRDRARAELDDVCRDLERWGFTNEWRECAFDRALFAEEEGASAHALELLKRIPPGDGDLKVTIASAYIAVATGARDRHERVEKLRALPEPDPTWWARGAYAAALAVIAKVDAAAWERVVAMLVLADQPVYVRRLAHARWRLAEHWRASRPEAAREQAELALAWYRGAIGYEDVVARLEEITGPSSP